MEEMKSGVNCVALKDNCVLACFGCCVFQEIQSMMLKNGFLFVKTKHLQLTCEKAELFYAEHKGMLSCMVLYIESKNVNYCLLKVSLYIVSVQATQIYLKCHILPVESQLLHSLCTGCTNLSEM